jgi:hypothetical protein
VVHTKGPFLITAEKQRLSAAFADYQRSELPNPTPTPAPSALTAADQALCSALSKLSLSPPTLTPAQAPELKINQIKQQLEAEQTRLKQYRDIG